METVNTWAEWLDRCVALKLSGPHKIWGQSQWQFTNENGTAALWNATDGKGYIFGQPSDKGGESHG